jgi:hypothetical protein
LICVVDIAVSVWPRSSISVIIFKKQSWMKFIPAIIYFYFQPCIPPVVEYYIAVLKGVSASAIVVAVVSVSIR